MAQSKIISSITSGGINLTFYLFGDNDDNFSVFMREGNNNVPPAPDGWHKTPDGAYDAVATTIEEMGDKLKSILAITDEFFDIAGFLSASLFLFMDFHSPKVVLNVVNIPGNPTLPNWMSFEAQVGIILHQTVVGSIEEMLLRVLEVPV